MKKTKTINIEKLDTGCIIIQDGKQYAKSHNIAALENLQTTFNDMIEKFSEAMYHNIAVTITVEFNTPKTLNR